MGPKRRLSSLKDTLHQEAHRFRELPRSQFPLAMELLGLRRQEDVPVDMFEREGAIVVRAEMAGVDPADIDVAVVNGELRISGERDEEETAGDGEFIFCERSHGLVSRTLPLPEGADTDAIRATMKNGLLEIFVPMARSSATRRIPITDA